MPAPRTNGWTLRDVERLVEARPRFAPRYELVDGELLVTPAPDGRHQRILGDLYRLADDYVRRERLGETRFSPAEVRLGPDTRFEPDLFVIPAVGGKRAPALAPVRRLLLAAEILSPSSARHDRFTKRRYFQRVGLPAYWVIDGDAEAFEIWHPGDERPAVVDDAFAWQPADAERPLVVDVARFFAAVRDDA